MPRTGLNYTSNTTALMSNEYPVVRTIYEIQERVKSLAYGLVDPKNEDKLVGNPRSDVRLIEDDAVVYSFTDTNGESFEVSVALDENGIHFDTSALVNTKVQATIRIIFLVCSPAECIKNAFNIEMVQPKGFFKAKKIPDARIYYGDEIKINPADLFEFTDAKMGDRVDGEAGGVEEGKESSGSGDAKEKKKKEDL